MKYFIGFDRMKHSEENTSNLHININRRYTKDSKDMISMSQLIVFYTNIIYTQNKLDNS